MAKSPKNAPGFGEERQAALLPDPALQETRNTSDCARLKIGPGGRVVIPADVRQALGVAEGDTLLATLADGELRLLSTSSVVKRAQAMVKASIPAGGASLVDELLADRRREVELEQERDRERGW